MNEIDSELYKDLIQQLETSLIITDEKDKIVSANPAFLTRSGYEINDILHKNIELFLEGSCGCDFLKEEVFVRGKDGREYLQSLYVNSNGTDGNHYRVWLLTDFKESGLDPLTKLPNRFLLNQQLNKAIDHAHESRSILAVLFLDLDRFKFVNDTLGHKYGDSLLKEAAKRIKDVVGDHNTIARMGGDEFVCVLENLGNVIDAENIAKNIITAFTKPFTLYETDIYISTSIGISFYPFDGDESEILITNADTSMYRAKKKGRNQYEKAQVDLNAGSFEKLLIENNLRKAIDEEEFELFFQPQVNLKTTQITSMEALIRWNHPDLGMISPGDFIPIAEEAGLILPIGEWVLKTACLKIKEWQMAGYPPVRIAVNLAAGQFLQNDLVQKVKNLLEETSVDPKYLELEITENMMMQDVQKAIDVIRELKEIGVSISIDDFGTGYSSLNYLRELPVDTLKIDRSFIFDIDKNQYSVALTKAITTLAHDMKLKVIAEGVETSNQLSMVQRFACDAVQGYYFCKPLKFDQIRTFISDYQKVKNDK